jgi:hypothetical protein
VRLKVSLSRSVAIALAIGAAFSVRAISNFAKESVAIAEAAATAQARLEGVAKATGVFGAETQKVTDRLGAFAKAQEMRIATDDKVIKGVQATLLSFKALSASADEAGGIFDRATIAAFDMGAAFAERCRLAGHGFGVRRWKTRLGA